MILILFFLHLAFADLQTLFGVGTSSSSLVNANKTIPYDAPSTSYNPAMQSLLKESSLSFGFIYSMDNFKEIGDVVVENEFYGGSNIDNIRFVDPSVDNTANFYLSSVILFNKEDDQKKRGVGFHLSLPVDKIMGVETQSAYYPQYSQYFADPQRMTMSFAYSWSTSENLLWGLGLHFYLVTGSTIRTILPASDSISPRSSSVDMKLEVKPSLAPSFGSIYKINEKNYISFNYIGERDAKLAFDANNSVNVLSVNPIPVNFNGLASLYYDPEKIYFGYSYTGVLWDFHLGIDYERWSKFSGSSVIMSFDSDTSFEQFLQEFKYKDMISPKLAVSRMMSRQDRILFGLAYRPSPSPIPEGNMNYLDSDKFKLGLGYMRSINGLPLILDYPMQFGLHAQTHFLKSEKVIKSGNDIGAPGYDIGGQVYSAGFSLNLSF